ncbi:MAG: chromosome segregation protein SMC, partial [Candidatus Omnitrophica bacterium]|nr:chromosome segregation protein SMC [Candidatus Omnitrophota bacterium]
EVIESADDFQNVEPSTYRLEQYQEQINLQKHNAEVREFKIKLAEMKKELEVQGLGEEIEQLKKRCESFGVVNLVAIEEYEELRTRFEFLTKQQSDLIEAKDALHQTINKINRTSRQMFVDTFTKVSEEFRIYFRMLFGGGEADLILVDPDDVLESGIDIIARPPGKKLQNIGLLSGGEKTMAAIALIFAVFKVKPSPFCVLDEIDAALDESNVGRYSYLLQEFSKIAQFVVITHNKKTINCANVMYGITMQERGVSKIVSVRLADDEKEVQKVDEIPVAV